VLHLAVKTIGGDNCERRAADKEAVASHQTDTREYVRFLA